MSDPQSCHPLHGRNSLAPLVKMVNEIDGNMAGSDDARATAVADHIRKFWSPSMRRQIVDYLTTNGAGLNPGAKRALALLEESSGSK